MKVHDTSCYDATVPAGYRSPGLVEPATCVVATYGPVSMLHALVAIGSVALLFGSGHGFGLRAAVSVVVGATMWVLGASRVVITFDEARMRVSVQRTLWPLRGRARVFDLASTSEARLATVADTVRFEMCDERGHIVDAIVVRRSDTAAVQFVERVFAVFEAR